MTHFTSREDRLAKLEAIGLDRILILDGAMGTMIQTFKLEEDDYRGARFADHGHPLKGNNDLLVITKPEIILGIHEAFLKAGADLISTNSFNATTISQADYALEPLAYELNLEAAKLARQACLAFETADAPKAVVGSIGPTNKTLSLSPDVNDPSYRAASFDEMVVAYREQTLGLLDGGVDLLLNLRGRLRPHAADVVGQRFRHRGLPALPAEPGRGQQGEHRAHLREWNGLERCERRLLHTFPCFRCNCSRSSHARVAEATFAA